MPRYGMDYGRSRMYGGGMNRAGYGADYYGGRAGGWAEQGGGRGAYGGRQRGGGSHPERGMRGRAPEYDTYYRRDFMTNQGDFSPGFGGGRDYGYEPMESDQWSRRLRGGWQRGYAEGFGPGDRDMGRGGMRGGRAGSPEGGYATDYRGGWEGYGGSAREEDRTSYGPHYGERWVSTHPEDISQRNFDRR